mgnify:CR=1 FL=1
MLDAIDIVRIKRTISKVDPRDYDTFVHKLLDHNLILGYIAEWHQSAYDSISPDVQNCVDSVIKDYRQLNPQCSLGREQVYTWMDNNYTY